ncbi:DUF1990 family protein [Microlunatus sp. GCM10028923]|uniref:DUF1990 family protein n=1 Tax=Microlunatus sp. GCM10028923 TaxID=3273400 RepID=UPI0036075EC9
MTLDGWPAGRAGYHRSEATAVIGYGTETWTRAGADLLRWRVKTASGFEVDDDSPVRPGLRVTVRVRLLLLVVVEPVEVAAVVTEPDRVGFSYRTLPGHPLCGEESFVLDRTEDEVRLTVRSITRPSPRQPWRALYPLLRIAQRIVRRRYLRALVVPK